MALEAVRSVVEGVRSLIASIKSEPAASSAEELQRGLLDIDSLLEDWIIAAEATNLLVEEVLDPLDGLDDRQRKLLYFSAMTAVGGYQMRYGHRLLFFVLPQQGAEYVLNPEDEEALHHVGASPERSARVMRLFEIYGEGTVASFRDLVITRNKALTALFADMRANFRFAPDRRQEMRDSYVDLLHARSELRQFIRKTFPIAPVPPPRPYNIHVSGGVVGNIGDYGSTELFGDVTSENRNAMGHKIYAREDIANYVAQNRGRFCSPDLVEEYYGEAVDTWNESDLRKYESGLKEED